MEPDTDREVQIETVIAEAIAKGEFRLVYQPIIDLKHHSVFGVEALLRWNNLKLGNIYPGEIIPIIEKMGNIVEVGEWILKTCIQHIKQWQKQDRFNTLCAINISSEQLNNHFVQYVEKEVTKNNIPPSSINIDLSETTIKENEKKAEEIIIKLHDKGIKTNIDDFGGDYSLLTRLKYIPFNTVKLDKSFLNDAEDNPDATVIMKAVINLAKNLGLKTVAIGIETKEQLDFVISQGCDYGQGYYFSKPIEATFVPDIADETWF